MYPNKYIALLILLVITLVIACNSEEEFATVDVNFTLTYDNEPLVAFEAFDYERGHKILFSKYSMFLSDLRLHNDEGSVLLSDVEFIDILDGAITLSDAQEGKLRTYSNVLFDEYSHLSFNIGVPAEVNATAPADYSSDNPLSNNGEYWVGWSSYIFHKIEGKMDADGDEDPEAGIALHIGSDQAFREIMVNVPISIDQSNEVININFDLKRNLLMGSEYYDFIETPQVHHEGVLPRVLPILDETSQNVEVREM